MFDICYNVYVTIHACFVRNNMTEYQKKLVELKQQGLPVSEIAKLVNRSVRTVSRNLKALGLTQNGRTDILNQDVQNMWNSGYTIVEIARYFNTSHETISKRLASMGIVCNRSDGIRRHFERIRGDIISRDYSVKREDGSNNFDRIDMQADFIKKAMIVHGSLYDYSQVVYFNSKTKVRILCSEHGIFEQTPDKHLQGRGCPLCGSKKLSFTNQSKYGVDRPLQNRDIHDKHVETCLAVYQAPNPMMAKSVQDKCKITVRERFGVDYTCQAESVMRARIETNIARYNGESPFCSDEIRQKALDAKFRKFGTTNTMSLDFVKQKIRDTKAKNNTFHVSQPENAMYSYLCDIFGPDNIRRQFVSSDYNFSCDFYIISRDLYIELNASWTHGRHWFDENSIEDMTKLDLWRQRGQTSAYYRNVLRTWTDLDVRKRQAAREAGLNYIVFWHNDLSDLFVWFAVGCPDGQDWLREYSWLFESNI